MNSVPAGYVEVRKGVYERRDIIKQKTNIKARKKDLRTTPSNNCLNE
jgi:hypothetical protein